MLLAAIDPTMIQGLGTFFLGVASLGTLIFTVANRTKILAFLGDRFLLVEATNDARRRAEAAEALAQTAERASHAMERNLQALEDRVQRLENIESKFDLLVSWVAKIVDYVIYLEREALGKGADLTQQSMPPLPAALKEDVIIPGGARRRG